MQRTFLATISLAVLSFALAPAPARSAEPGMAQPAAEFSDAELRAFAKAAAKVQRINDVYVPKLSTAASEDEQKQVQETATAEMRRALDDEGISVDKFREIVTRAQVNPGLAGRIREQVRQSQ